MRSPSTKDQAVWRLVFTRNKLNCQAINLLNEHSPEESGEQDAGFQGS